MHHPVDDTAHDTAQAQPPPLPPPLPTPPEPVRHPVEFTGNAREYFGIWIVNLVLSVLTLGIYSAWAKVRTERYFYGNTHLAGAPFEYLADPIAILKGRLIAYAVVIGLGLTAHFQLFAFYIPLLLLVLALLPWVIQLKLRFRARYSAWRGLRFRFVDGVYEAYLNFMFRPMLLIVTLYLMLPWVRMHQHDYTVAGHRFGGKRFSFRGDLGTYYIPFLIALGLGVAAYVVMMVLIVAVAAIAGTKGEPGATPSTSTIVAILVPVMLGYLLLLAVPVFLRTRYTNLMWRYSALGENRFESTLRARDIIWIYFSNGIAIVLSLGMLVPWAMVRLARYRAAHFFVVAASDLDGFVAEAEREEGAAGYELVDALDFDVDIGL
jgi:uncharacterized membrane protein YjgN (DUF898 family)